MPARARFSLLVVAAALFASANAVAAQAGDAQAKKLTKQAMDQEYGAKDYKSAVKKLGQAATACETSGCIKSVHAQIYACLALVHWNGTEDYDSAADALRTMVRLDPRHKLDKRLATIELGEALDTAKEDVRTENTAPAAAPGPAAAPAAAPEAAAEPLDPEEANLDPKEREFRRQVAARKAAHAREAEETRIRVEREAAQRAIEERREAGAAKAAEARRVREEKKAAARKLADEKKAAGRLAAEQRKAEAARLAFETQRQAEEKKEFDRKQVEDAKKAEEEERLKVPIKAGKLDETVWQQQVVGYPLPVYVKLPPPPPGIEKERTEVVKVVTEYFGPGTPIPMKFELPPLGAGGFGGLLPCDATSAEGTLTYFTIALNKYDNLVALGGSPVKPHKVKVQTAIEGNPPRLPGDPPPKSCAEIAAQPPAPAGCNADSDCPDGGVCAQKACATPSAAPPMPGPRGWRACKCEIGAAKVDLPHGAVLAVIVSASRLCRKRRHGDRAA